VSPQNTIEALSDPDKEADSFNSENDDITDEQ
jgi:hypothetical protein